MMDYGAKAETVRATIEKYGASISFTRSGVTGYDPATAATVATPSSFSGVAVVFDYKNTMIDGTRILQGDKQAYVSCETEPQQGDKATWAEVLYEVKNCKPLAPAGVAVMYELQLRA